MVSVSVIIPVYNSELYLAKALNSAMAQTLTNIEIICVDDGSVDHSKDIIRTYCQRDSRIIYVYQKNSGPGVARNLGMAYAKGEYIAFLDSDDEYPGADALKLLYTKAKVNDAHICGGSVCGDEWQRKPDAVFPTEGFYRFADFQNDYMFWRFIYRRKFLEEREFKFPDYRLYEDPVFLLAVMDSAQCFYAITEDVYKKNDAHLSVEKLSITNTVQRLAGIETNIRLAVKKGYAKVNQRNLNELCKLSGRIAELVGEQAAAEALYEQLMRIIPLISIKNSSAAGKISISRRIRVILLLMIVLSMQHMQLSQTVFLIYKYLEFSIVYYCLRIRNLPAKILREMKAAGGRGKNNVS